jgi:hypothetical protein
MLTNCSKTSNIKFNKNPFGAYRVVTCEQTDTHWEAKGHIFSTFFVENSSKYRKETWYETSNRANNLKCLDKCIHQILFEREI